MFRRNRTTSGGGTFLIMISTPEDSIIEEDLASINIEGCTFDSNRTAGNGGDINISMSSTSSAVFNSLNIINTSFTGTEAESSGIIFISSDIEIRRHSSI